MEFGALVILWIVASIVVALSAAAELAVATASRGETRDLSEAGDWRAAFVEKLQRNASHFLLTTTLLKSAGILLAGAGVAFVSTTFESILQPILLLLLAWILLASVQVVTRALVLPHSQTVALQLSPLLGIIVQLFRPISASLLMLGEKLSGGRVDAAEETIFLTEDGLRLLLNVSEEEEGILDSEKEMIASILDMDETLVREVMVPRIDMVALNVQTTLRDALGTVISAGHSRIPVYEGNIDRVVGFLYAKDLLKCFHDGESDPLIGDMLRPAHFIPASKKTNALLREMQRRRVHIAMVVDEYGGTAGLVTIEDLIEEIVGEIEDEYDTAADLLIESISDGAYLLNSRLDINSLAELLGVDVIDQSADTLGGMIYSLLGHVPEQGETVDVDHWRLTVVSLDGRRIDQVRAELLQPADSPESQELSNVDDVASQAESSLLNYPQLD